MRPAWPQDTVFRRLVLDIERRLLRTLRRQVKAVVAVEGRCSGRIRLLCLPSNLRPATDQPTDGIRKADEGTS
jgi:hypothetical protein